jgi:hypothetical protein
MSVVDRIVDQHRFPSVLRALSRTSTSDSRCWPVSTSVGERLICMGFARLDGLSMMPLGVRSGYVRRHPRDKR